MCCPCAPVGRRHPMPPTTTPRICLPSGVWPTSPMTSGESWFRRGSGARRDRPAWPAGPRDAGALPVLPRSGAGRPRGPCGRRRRGLGRPVWGAGGPPADLASVPEAGSVRLLRVAAEPGQTGPLAGWGRAWEVPPALIRGDLRGARAWVDAKVRGQGLQGVEAEAIPQVSRPLVVLLGPCRFEDLARWQAMLELMGLA
jgi:hypothetical protein